MERQCKVCHRTAHAACGQVIAGEWCCASCVLSLRREQARRIEERKKASRDQRRAAKSR